MKTGDELRGSSSSRRGPTVAEAHPAQLRRTALRQARRALRSGGRGELEAALAGLPSTGLKATALRARIDSVLGRQSTTSESDLVEREVARCISNGVVVRVCVGDIGASVAFDVRQVDAVLMVVLNSAHKFWTAARLDEIESSGLARELLVAWALFECQQIPSRRHVAVDARCDWSRALRSSVLSGGAE